jgi:hypothetical protein
MRTSLPILVFRLDKAALSEGDVYLHWAQEAGGSNPLAPTCPKRPFLAS